MKAGDIVLGKYRLNLPLGSGGMAEVWSATNTFTERQLAIKFMAPEVARSPEAAARFLKEAKVSARVNHPNIIDVLDVGQTEEGQLFLVMELLTGFPLETALRRQTPPMTVHELILVMIEVAEALAAAHRSGIVHRDLKPTNVFLHTTRAGVLPKLLDFGVSKFLGEDVDQALTLSGTVLGSPLYMSPEQARGESAIDGRSDIFAFGAILFEALTGQRAYEAQNFNALIVKIATTKPRSIDVCAPHLPDALRRVVRACMEHEVKRRAPSFDGILPMLRHALPELEAAPAYLPNAQVPPSLVDPDETQALPVLPKDARGRVRALSLPDVAIQDLRAASTVYGAAVSTRPAARSSTWLVAAGVAIVAVGIGLGGFVVLSSTSSGATAPSQPPTSARPATPKTGQLTIAASPGACAVTVDGIDRGSTPTAAIDLAPGRHAVTCVAAAVRGPDAGVARSAEVSVTEGAAARYRFLLDDE